MRPIRAEAWYDHSHGSRLERETPKKKKKEKEKGNTAITVLIFLPKGN